jgi:hypothetical protein
MLTITSAAAAYKHGAWSNNESALLLQEWGVPIYGPGRSRDSDIMMLWEPDHGKATWVWLKIGDPNSMDYGLLL